MAYAIMRWVKVTSQKQADDATGHNARTSKVANADKEAPHPNIEFVITDGRGYWELATERIAQVVTRKVRDDQVRCMEVILTASPEFFERDANGRAVDMKDSQWAKDQLTFLEKTFGKENVLSCTLHQDEKSPHVHAVIAPITEDGHLSAKRLFNPITMTGYQTAYAEAMEPHGLARGVEHSQAEHQPMTRMYGQQKTTAAELGAQLGPVSSYQDEQVKRPGAKDYLNLSEWEAKTSAQVNEKARAQVEEANQRAEKAQNLALEIAAAKDQVRVLQKQLSTSEELKEGHYGKLVDAAKRAAGGEPASPELIKQGNKLLDKDVQDVQQSRERVVKLHAEADQADKRGDWFGLPVDIRAGSIPKEEAHQKKLELSLRSYKGGIERLDQRDAQQAQERADKAKQQAERERQAAEQARLVKEAAEQKRIEQANLAAERERQAAEQARLVKEAAEQKRIEQANLAAERMKEEARQKAENERQKPIVRENERQQIEKVFEQSVKNNLHVYNVEDVIDVIKNLGVNTLKRGSTNDFALAGSENRFTVNDIRPGGKDLNEMVGERINSNNGRVQRELEKEKGKEKDNGQSM